MIAQIQKSMLSGTVKAPPSKSMAHRLAICACLSDGESKISGLDVLSEDVQATISCMEKLGAKISISGDKLCVQGFDISKSECDDVLCVRESGSTLRFLIPLCLMTDKKISLTGSVRLFERPLGVYETICRQKGFLFEKKENRLTVCGKLKPGTYEIPGDISSQFVSGLLFALPLLDGDSTIKIIGKLESKPYVLMTIEALLQYGVDVSFVSDNEIAVKGNQAYKPNNCTVEGDYSNAAFFEALNLFGHNVKVVGLCENSLQGDKVYKEYFKALSEGFCTLDVENCPDLAPMLMAVAAEKHGAIFTGTRRLKIKESDRADTMKEELSKLGAHVEVEENSVTVKKTPLHPPLANVESHKDHRIVMALSVMLTKYGGKVNNCQDVSKSMPDFFERLTKLGAKVDISENQ